MGWKIIELPPGVDPKIFARGLWISAFATAILFCFCPDVWLFFTIHAGLNVGLLAGIPMVAWSKREQAFKSLKDWETVRTTAVLGIIWFAIFHFECFNAIPSIIAQERVLKEMVKLGTVSCDTVRIDYKGRHIVLDENQKALFQKYLTDVRLFYPSHERDVHFAEISLTLKNGEVVTLDASEPERRRDDISLTCKTIRGYQELVLIGARNFFVHAVGEADAK